MKIDEMIDAFDAVLPGYAWTWHDAMAASRAAEWQSSKGWRDPRRRNLTRPRDRCLLIYGYRPSEDDDCSLLIWNRGYVDLLLAVVPDRDEAIRAFGSMRNNSRTDDPHYFYSGTANAAEFDTNCEVCRNVLTYIRDTASSITPMWQDEPNLTRTS